jgi:hypothetical protein
MPNIDEEIRSKTEVFARDLTVLVRRAALEAAAAALGGGSMPAAAPIAVAAKRGRGRPRKVVAPAAVSQASQAAAAPKARAAAKAAPKAAPVSRAAVSKRAAAKRAPGEKRPPAELTKLVDKLGEYIKANPGRRMESIGKALGMPTRELNLPIKKLLAAKRIRSEGHKRATEYFPG